MRAIYSKELKGGVGSLIVGEVAEAAIHEDDQVLIKVAAAGVNYEDLLHLYDKESAKHIKSPYLGFECSGHVIATGSKVTTCRKGDRVCAFTRGGGSYAEIVAVPEIFVVVIPPGMALKDAAALPQASCLTLWCFRHITPGMKILIHEGGGGFGCIAIQYAKHIGCEVYATEVSEERVKLCQFWGAKVCINSTKENFCKRVLRETNNQGVDIILDHVGEEYLHKNLLSLSTGGSLIVVESTKGLGSVNLDLLTLEHNRISILGCSLRFVDDEVISDLLKKAVRIIGPLIAGNVIKPKIGAVFDFDEAEVAFVAWKFLLFPGKILLVP